MRVEKLIKCKDYLEAWRKADFGEKIRYVGDDKRHIVKSDVNDITDYRGEPYAQIHLDHTWEIVRMGEQTHTTITTGSGRKVKLTIEDAEKLNLI